MKKDYIVELREEEADELMNEHWVGELVRCKDCEYFRDTKNVYNGEPFGTCTNCRTSMTGYALHSFEWFCADGKRKEGR